MSLLNRLLCIVLLGLLALPSLPPVAADEPSDPSDPGTGDCRWVEIRQPLPGSDLPRVIVDPDGCIRDAVRRVIGWS